MRLSAALPATDEIEARTGVARFVRDELVRCIAAVATVDSAAIYGSRARGDFVSYSDIDIALFGDGVTVSDVARIKDALDESAIVFPVDVTAVASLPADSSMRRAIDRDGITIYERTSDPSAASAR